MQECKTAERRVYVAHYQEREEICARAVFKDDVRDVLPGLAKTRSGRAFLVVDTINLPGDSSATDEEQYKFSNDASRAKIQAQGATHLHDVRVHQLGEGHQALKLLNPVSNGWGYHQLQTCHIVLL